MLTLGLDDFGQSMSTAVKHMNLSFLFLRQFLENLKMHKHHQETKIEEQNRTEQNTELFIPWPNLACLAVYVCEAL